MQRLTSRTQPPIRIVVAAGLALTIPGCFIVPSRATLVDRASAAGVRRSPRCAGEEILSHPERAVFDEALRSIVQEHVTLTTLSDVTLEILPCGSVLLARAEGERIEMSLAFARFLLDSSDGHTSHRRRNVRFAIAHELAHLVDVECTPTADDAHLCRQSLECELRADRIASRWQRVATSEALLSMARYALGRLAAAARVELQPVDSTGSRSLAARRREALGHCVMAAEFTVRAAHVDLFEHTRGDRRDAPEDRDRRLREYDQVRAVLETGDLQVDCATALENATAELPFLSPDDRTDHDADVLCMEQRYRALQTARAELQETLRQPVDARTFMSTESRWTDDALFYVRAHGGIGYSGFQSDHQADAGWVAHGEVGARFLNENLHVLVGVMGRVSQFDARPSSPAMSESPLNTTATHVGLTLQGGIALLPPFGLGARFGLGWVRVDFADAETIDGFFGAMSLFADWALDPRFHIVLAGHLSLDVAEERLYALPLAATLGLEAYFGSH